MRLPLPIAMSGAMDQAADGLRAKGSGSVRLFRIWHLTGLAIIQSSACNPRRGAWREPGVWPESLLQYLLQSIPALSKLAASFL